MAQYSANDKSDVFPRSSALNLPIMIEEEVVFEQMFRGEKLCWCMDCGSKTIVLVTNKRLAMSGTDSSCPWPLNNFWVAVLCCLGCPLLCKKNYTNSISLNTVSAFEVSKHSFFPEHCPALMTLRADAKDIAVEISSPKQAMELKAALIPVMTRNTPGARPLGA